MSIQRRETGHGGNGMRMFQAVSMTLLLALTACSPAAAPAAAPAQAPASGASAAPSASAQWQQIVVFLSVASMLLGAFAAIGQTNIKRLMAYSSIGHIGYALIGLAADSETGTQAVLVYLAIYLFMTIGAFACILSMRNKLGPVEDIESLAGLAKTNLPMAFVLAMILFSMAGVPPLAGFFAMRKNSRSSAGGTWSWGTPSICPRCRLWKVSPSTL